MQIANPFVRPEISPPDTIVLERSGGLATVRLNTPRTLNAISGEMAVALAQYLDTVRGDAAVRAVSISAEGEKAFSAGGDIRNLYAAIVDQRFAELYAFFAHEYRMNREIYRFNKPFVAWVHGIVMGGGTGVSLHASHVVVSESSIFAMPEVMIGFVPDVGASFFFNKFPPAVARMLALTGTRVGAADLCHYGVAHYYIPRARWPAAQAKLTEVMGTPIGGAGGDYDRIANVLASFAEVPPETTLVAREAEIASVFGSDNILEIAENLRARAEDPFFGPILALFQQASPTSLALETELLRRARGQSIETAIQLEYSLACWLMHRPDIVEGIREAVIDKTRNPTWQPARLEEVTAADIDAAFNKMHATRLFTNYL